MSKEEPYAYLLGKAYPLKTELDQAISKPKIRFDGNAFLCICPHVGEQDVSEAFKAFYIKEAKTYIGKRLKAYQSQMRVKYKSFAIDSDNGKWGSCNSKKHLTFHWRLMLFPETAIDYVVVHELCHLEHMNHDRSFWRLVGKIYPDYKKAMAMIGSEK